MKLGVVQTNTGNDRAENARTLLDLLEAVPKVDMVLTPECTNLMGYNPKADYLLNTEIDPVIMACRSWARANETYFLIGSALILENGKPFNRQLLINPNGEIISQYDKIHMFDVNLSNGENYRESDRTIAGDKAVVSEINGVKFGHAICFDLRFPVLFNALSYAGAQVLLVPAAFTQITGRAHWEVLLRSRAIENAAYVIAPAQCGSYKHFDGGVRHCFGHSMVVTPWGEVKHVLDDVPGFFVVDIDLSKVAKARADIPVISAAREFKRP